jgi:adenylate cyclase
MRQGGGAKQREGGRRRWAVAAGVGLVAAGLVLPVERFPALYPGPLGEFLAGVRRGGNAVWYDTLLRGRRMGPAPEVALVALDDHTTRAFGVPVLPRACHARLIRNLQRAGARVILFDMLFEQPREGDDALAAAMRAHGRVILAWAREESADPNGAEAHPVLPNERLARAAFAVANANLPNDPDGLIRRFPWAALLPDPDDVARLRRLPGLAVAAAGALADPDAAAIEQELGHGRAGGHVLVDARVDEEPTSTIAYRGPGGFSCRRVPYYQVYWADDPRRADVDLAQLRRWVAGRVVLVGAVTESAHDTHPTPWGKMPGAEVQANALDTVLSGRFLRPAPEGARVALLVLGCLVMALEPLLFGRLWLMAGAGVALFFLPLGASAALFRGAQIWLPPVDAMAGMGLAFLGENLYLYSTQRRRARDLRRHFARFVGPRVLREILSEGYVELEGERREITVLFSDLQGFTTLSERLPPAQTVALLNQYLNRMVAVIFAHEGTLDKFMGDGIMAYFGAPQPSPDHAAQAVRCALEMQRALAQWREETAGQALPPVFMRIGVHTGAAVVGEMGSRLQVSYTAIGDTVNVAARLEPLNKEFGTSILISEHTRAGLGPDLATEFKGELQVKGRAEPVRVYAVQLEARETQHPKLTEGARA